MTKVNVAGIDISKKFFDVLMITGGEHQQKQFSNDAAGIKAAAQWLKKEVHCVMEVTGCYYMRLALYLQQHGFRVSVVNPLVIKRFSQMRLIRAKTDKADANMIAQYALTEQPEAWTPPQQYSVTLQQLDGISEQLSKQHTALNNQLEAFTQSGMMEKGTKQFLLKSLKLIRQQQHSVEKKTNELIRKYHGEMIGCLTTIPGLGNKTASMLIVITDGFKKFSSHKQLSAYVGISPRIFESGSSIRGKTRVCKMGMSRIRALLYVCAWSAKRYNRACKELYDRLVQKGKAKKQALIAVANKLLKQAFAIAINNEKYSANYVKKICL
jgi:transposase